MTRRMVVLVATIVVVASAVWIVAAAGSGSHHAARAARSTTATTQSPHPSSPSTASTSSTAPSTTTSGATTSTTRGTTPPTPTTSRAGTGSLAGKVITIDPGHDGGNAAHVSEIDRKVWIRTGMKACNTVGTESNAGYPEHVFTWETALLVKAKLQALGATVVLTRPNDTGWGPCIDQRAAIGNQAHSAAAVAIHADGGPASGRGFFVIAQDHTPGISTSLYDASGRLATSVRDAVRSGTAMPTSDYAGAAGFMRSPIYGGLNLSEVPAMFIECGNMRNATDATLLESATFREQLASAIVAGIATFVG